MFCKKVRSCVILKTIEGHFSAATLTKLKNNSDKFRLKESNGQFFDNLTMLLLLVKGYNPSVQIGVKSLKKNIENARLLAFQHNLP